MQLSWCCHYYLFWVFFLIRDNYCGFYSLRPRWPAADLAQIDWFVMIRSVAISLFFLQTDDMRGRDRCARNVTQTMEVWWCSEGRVIMEQLLLLLLALYISLCFILSFKRAFNLFIRGFPLFLFLSLCAFTSLPLSKCARSPQPANSFLAQLDSMCSGSNLLLLPSGTQRKRRKKEATEINTHTHVDMKIRQREIEPSSLLHRSRFHFLSVHQPLQHFLLLFLLHELLAVYIRAPATLSVISGRLTIEKEKPPCWESISIERWLERDIYPSSSSTWEVVARIRLIIIAASLSPLSK